MRLSESIKNYVLVAKPGIILGNLISAAAGFLLASKGRVDGVALSATLIGISLVVASGCVFNNCVDRNLDRKMLRTRHRVLAQGLIKLQIVVSYATILGLAGLTLLTLYQYVYMHSARTGELEPVPELATEKTAETNIRSLIKNTCYLL